LPPVKQGREFYSLDSARNPEAEKQPVKVGFYGSARHFELGGDFCVITALQKQFYDLLFAGS
jgi:protein-S-isoprenylcysteine O-methyltransferase Ste14